MRVSLDPRHARWRRACAWLCLAAVVSLVSAPASARIVRTRSVTRTEGINLLLGIGAEFAKGEYAIPLLIEWSPTDALTWVIEPSYGAVDTDEGWIRGSKDLETSLIYDLVPVAADQTGFGVEFGVKIPTASDDELGSGKTDYRIGIVVAREFAGGELELNLAHVFIGEPKDRRFDNETEASIAGEWALTDASDFIAEIVVNHGGGVYERDVHGSYSAAERSGYTTQLTVGLAQDLSPHLQIEEGVSWISDGTWQGQIALEWNFAEDD